MADWTMGFPPGLEWRNVTLTKPNWTPIQLAVLQTKLGVMQALGGTLGLDVVAKLNDDLLPDRSRQRHRHRLVSVLGGPRRDQGTAFNTWTFPNSSAAMSRMARSTGISPIESTPARRTP